MIIKKSLCQYYTDNKIRPVYSKLIDTEMLNSYEWVRRKLFEYNLSIPIRTFKDASLLEFGPSTGENSLIFAKWGAQLSLVEPVDDFINGINEYFTLHEVTKNLTSVKRSTFEKFETDKKYDFVVAEGFIFHTGRPAYWLPRLSSFCKKGGFIVISHSETVGFIIELLHSKCLQFFQSYHNKDPLLLAKKLFLNKWNKVSHARNFEAWAYDNLVNPTLSPNLLNSFMELQEVMAETGMIAWSSWPSVNNYTDISWIKKSTIDVKSVVQRNRFNFLSLLPSMVLGKHIRVNNQISKVGELLFSSLTSYVNSLAAPMEVDTFNREYIEKLQYEHNKIMEIFRLCVPNFYDTILAELWQEISDCLKNISDVNIDGAIKLFNGNGPLSEYWGCPNFYSVWHRYDQDNKE